MPILRSLLMLNRMWCCCWWIDVYAIHRQVTEVDVVIYCSCVNMWRPIPIVFVDIIVMLLLNCVGVDVYVLRWQVRANTNYWDDSSIPSSAREKTQRSKTDSHFLSKMRQFNIHVHFPNIFGPTKSQIFMLTISLLTNARNWQKAKMPQKWLQ